MKLNRRGFLAGLFGTAAVAKLGPMPKALAELPDERFKAIILNALPRNDEVWGNDEGGYAFATVTWSNEPPYIKVTVPEGFRPLREESDRIGREAIARMKRGLI